MIDGKMQNHNYGKMGQ